MPEIYRQCAGAVVFNSDGKVLLCSRNDVSGDQWQFPQGGIEKGEHPEEAARRELFEETSIVSVTMVSTDKHPNRYDFPDEIRKQFRTRGIITAGQDIYFSLYFFTGKNEEINLKTANPEFKNYIWEELSFAVEHIIFFKKRVYMGVLQRFAPLIRQYLNNIP